MSSRLVPAILGTGFAVPNRIIENDDPIFDYLRENHPPGSDLFAGYKQRRFLEPGETIQTFVTAAARRALSSAELTADDVDRVYGYVTVSQASTPNLIGELHKDLQLGRHTRVLAVNTEFTNFVDAVEMASDAVRAGSCHYALLAFGCNWSRYVDYRTPPSLSASDGAGAVVIGPAVDTSNFRLIDSESLVDSQYFGTMQMAPEAVPNRPESYTHPYFQILAGGVDGFNKFAIPSVPAVTAALLRRNKITGADITLITHQASSVMMDTWKQEIAPAYYASTMAEYANTTLAALPITLAARYADIPTDWVVICGVGHYFHTTAILLGRNIK